MEVRERTPEEGRSGGVPTSDGAVREMEKADIAARSGARRLRPDDEPKEGEVISLGKDAGGAPEDAVQDSREAREEGRDNNDARNVRTGE
jgi:hypothetical protein